MEKNKHTDTTNEAIKSSDPKRGSRIGRFAVPAVVGISSVLGVGGATSLLMGHNAIHQADQIVGTNRLDAQNIISQSQKINEDNQTIQQFQRKSNNLKSSYAEAQKQEGTLVADNKILSSITSNQNKELQQFDALINADNQKISGLESAQSGLEKSANQAEATRLTDELNAQGVTSTDILNGTVTLSYGDGSKQSFWDPFVLSTSNGQKNVGFANVTGIGIQAQTGNGDVLIEPIAINQSNETGVTFIPNKPLQETQPNQTVVPIYALTNTNTGNTSNRLVYAAQLENGRYNPLQANNEIIYPGTLLK